MARTPNRSEPETITITVPYQTHAYLVKMAEAGAGGQHEAIIAAQIVIRAVEKLMKEKRAEMSLVGFPKKRSQD